MNAVELIAVFFLRAGQALMLCLPTLLAGMLIAGALTALAGGERVRYWLARGDGFDRLRAWALVPLLACCSMGVLPVLATLRRQGVRAGTLVFVAMTAPVFTPYTAGYMADRAGIAGFGAVLLSNLALALAAAWAADRFSRTRPVADVEVPVPASRVMAVLRDAGRSLSPGVLSLIGLGLIGVGLMAVVIPPNEIGEHLVDRDWRHALLLASVGPFSYVPPEGTALQAGEVVTASAMPGLLVPIIALGAACHLGTLGGGLWLLGRRGMFAVTVAVLAVTFAGGLLVDEWLKPGAMALEDSHAFEEYGRPFHLLDHPSGWLVGVRHRFTQPLKINEAFAGAGVLVLVACRRLRVPAGDRPVAPYVPWVAWRCRALGGVIAVTLTVAFVYTYVPATEWLGRDLRATVAEYAAAVGKGDAPAARRAESRLRRRLAQLPWAAWLRGRPFSLERQQAMEAALHHLDGADLEHAAQADAKRDMVTLAGNVLRASRTS